MTKLTGIRKVVFVLAGVVAALAPVAVLYATEAPASASAYGCTGYGSGISWQGMYIKNGTWCGSIVGNGTYVSYVGGNFYTHVAINAVCNFSERAEFFDSNGHYYGYVQSPTYYRCSYASDLPNMYLNQYVRRGFVNMKLLSNGGTVATVQESIL